MVYIGNNDPKLQIYSDDKAKVDESTVFEGQVIFERVLNDNRFQVSDINLKTLRSDRSFIGYTLP